MGPRTLGARGSYGGGVAASRARELWWWFLVVATTIGLIAMHGLVGHEEHQSTDSPTTMVAIAEASCCNHEHSAPLAGMPDRTSGQGSALTPLLHLCLAVLTGLTLLTITALLAYSRLVDAVADHLSLLALRFGRTRAPPPTSVRLAQLCVLRR